IPLGPTGIGIYGFRGLLGQRYVASKTEAGLADDGSWYEYYKAKVSPDYCEGIQVSKFAQQEQGFSVGAGVSLATAFDGGKVFSAKVFVLLSLPDVLLIQGQGAILKERVGLDTTTDPPFSAMIAISSDSIESAFGANLNLPESGKIAKVSGAIEMGFFFANSGAWYVNLGRNLPEEKRIRVELFTLFNAYFYLMLNKQGIAAGAGSHWEFSKKLGPLSVSAFAYLDVTGKIAFKPVQIGGSIALSAGASLGIWRLRLGMEVSAFLAAEAPKPFIITGALSFQLDLPRPIRKLGGPYSLDFTWSFDKERDLSPIDLLDTNKAVRAVHQLTGETYPLYYSTSGNEASNMTPFVIPVDSFIDIEFLKAMGIQNTLGLKKFGVIWQGSHYTELVPPQKGKSQQVRHEFRLEDIVIEYKNGNSWELYDMYQGIRPASTDETEIDFPENTENMLCGYWQCDTKDKHQKLRIFAQSPLSYLTHFTSGLPVLPEDLGYQQGFLFCEGQLRPKTCVTFPKKGQLFRAGEYTERQRVLVRLLSSHGVVTPRANSFGLQNALNFKGKAEFFFDQPQAKVILKLSSYAQELRVSYWCRKQVSNAGFANLPVYETIHITETIITPATDGNVHTLVYSQSDYSNAAVEFITIESIGGDIDSSNVLTEEPELLVQENSGTLLLEDAQEHVGATQLFSICTLTVTDYNYNLSTKTQTEVDETVHAMRENFTTHCNPIWRPNTLFRIKIATYDALPEETVNEEEYRKNHYFFFKTAGTLGHFHEHNQQYQSLQALGREDQFKLASLKPYIDYSRSYPNADGRLTNAKPLFYNNPKLLMFYTENSIYAMYNGFAPYGNQSTIHSTLNVLIKSPTEIINTDPENPTAAIPSYNSWKKNPDAIMTPEVRMLNNVANGGANCAGFNEFTPLSVMQEIVIGTLRPDTLYTAIFNAEYSTQSNTVPNKTQVHSYVFKTSQYADFTAQVQSCCLRDDAGNEVRKAVFTLEKEFDANTIAQAIALLSGNLPQTDPLVNAYVHDFNRLTDGILQLGALPPATSTDFTIVKNSSTNTIVGIIVRNPEPFNDPKIPAADLSNTIGLQLGGTSNYTVIFSADNTQAFISNAAVNVPSGTAQFTFNYKQYNMTTKTYTVLATENVEIEI
ncbi:MAG: hypothetical protein LBM68_05520, partial [Bacteroidales bacterium]|nr:hypothetical protein [Bacteroidales bacterium]